MENREYTELIYNNKLNDLANIWNISDLTEYTYLKKYLLEYLLKENIHTTRMDNYAKNDIIWIKLYIKYGITKPLLDVPLDKLLTVNNHKLLIETLLNKLNKTDKIKLYNNFKNNSYYLLHKNETLIIQIYAKYNIKLTSYYPFIPSIYDDNIKMGHDLELLINEFKKAFSDISENILIIYINEFKRTAKISRKKVFTDIQKLINYKKNNPKFKLTIDEYESDDIYQGEYDSEKQRIVINKYHHGTFTHELSHLLYYEIENPLCRLNRPYKTIQDKINTTTVTKIINYLKEFHARYDYMEKQFCKLYYLEIKKKYGNLNNYYEKIFSDLLNSKPECINLDGDDIMIIPDYYNLDETIMELINYECEEYATILVKNYYWEELMFENLLDAILKGNIFDGKYDLDSLSGHSIESFNNAEDLSFNECLADYYAIINSRKANIFKNKLRELVGNELVNLLDKYISDKRYIKVKRKYK